MLVTQLPEVSKNEDGSTTYQHPSGLKFKYNPNNASFSATKGLSSFGDRLSNPQFMNTAGMREACKDFHTYADHPITLARTGEESETHKEIYDAVTGENIAILTKDYRILQNDALFGTFANVCDKMNVNPIGRISVGERGFTVGHATFVDPEMTINILEQYDEPVMFTIDLRNSFDGRMGAYIGGAAIFTICFNLSLWGKSYQSVWIPHDSAEIDRVPEILEKYLAGIASGMPSMVRIFSDAEGRSVEQKEISDILWGTTIPQGIIDAIASNPLTYNTRLKEHELSMFQLYNCVTNALTFRQTESYKTTMSYTESAMNLLTKKKDRLMEDGEIRRKKYAEQITKAAIKRKDLKQMASAKTPSSPMFG